MAKTKQRRRRKHRGTQGGRIDRRGRTSRPMNRAEARAQLRGQRAARFDRPPTWRGAINRGVLAAAVFFLVLLLAFGRPFIQAFSLAAFMLLFYIPMGYFMDSFLYRRRQRKKQRPGEQGPA
jgi:hypothetical protein